MKYKVIESTIEYFKSIELEFDFSDKIVGDVVNILGQVVTLSQVGNGVIGGSNPDFVIFLQEIIEEEKNNE